MSKSFVHFTCWLIVVITMCIDEGNGNWKNKYRNNLQEDIVEFEEMADKIEDEIEDFYDEYSEKWPNHESLINEKGKLPKISQDSRKTKILKNYVDFLPMFSRNITNNFNKTEISLMPKNTISERTTPEIDVTKEIRSTEKAIVSTKWPKFEDILLEMGKKYDWKNDRWIKVKKKANQTNEENHLTSHERHKFSYKTVKLNRGKSRRNVVIAVTAVR